MVEFTHLHTHSEYSLLDGAARVKDLVKRASELKMQALALTDHGVMYGTVDFYEAAVEAGLKPIIGCEVYLAPGSRFDKTSRQEESYHHLVLLAENNTGYCNLMALVTKAFMDGFYYRPRVDWELLAEHKEGLIALSACLSGEIPKSILQENQGRARQIAQKFQELFGSDNFFIELQDQGIEEQKLVNEKLVELARDLKIPLVATNDVHYTEKQDSVAHDVLLCIQTGATIEDKDRLQFSTREFYLKSAEEMAALFPELPEALENTRMIAERCDVKVDFDRVHLPHFACAGGQDPHAYLTELCNEGLKNRYPAISPEVEERLHYELDVIKETGFSGYFLIVWDFCRYARAQGITVGPGRGSAAGSIVAYLLGVTSIDPLRHKLVFERFLNPERVSMPDIDIDFCDERRDEVIDYVAKKYGRDRVAQIITFSTMAARAATRDAGRVLGFPYGRVDRVAKLIPEIPGMTIETALETVPELRQEHETDEEVRRIIDTARALEGLSRQDSIHAAGVVIAPEKLTQFAPLQRKGEAETVTQYHMKAVQKIGLLKMDLLGIRTLTVIENAVKIIGRTRGEQLDIEDIPLDDGETFAMLQGGESIGVFQLESSGMRTLLRELSPTNFEDLVALLALYRPGPLRSGMTQDFVERKHGRRPITYLHPSLESILKETYGTIVYQEQVMQIASQMAGFSMAEADILRKAMSKTDSAVFKEQRQKFINGASSKSIAKESAEKVFDLVAHFAGYGFNRSHSTGYALISYQTAYLKAHYPAEFMAAVLTSVMDKKEKVALYVNECRRLGIKVLPPHVNESLRGFTVVGDDIRFGLSAVRNVGEGLVEAVIEGRKNKGTFKSLFDFCQKVDLSNVNKRALEALIKGGAFDGAGLGRKQLLKLHENAMGHGQQRQRDNERGQASFFDTGGEDLDYPAPDGDDFAKAELLAQEKEVLGLYVSDHPLLEQEKLLKSRTQFSLEALKEQREGLVCWVGGIVANVNRITTKKGEMMAFLTLEDLEASAELVVFPSIYQKNRELMEEDAFIRAKGRLDAKEDQCKLIALEVEPLAAEEKKSAAVHLRLSSELFSRELLDQLKRILRTHPGPAPVFLEVKDAGRVTTLRLGQGYQVQTYSPLFAELKALLGEKAVSFQ